MPENYEPDSTNGSGIVLSDTSTSLDAAKHEASELKDTAVGQAKGVAGTVKSEASAVLGEAKYQAKDLIAQTQSELKEQANTQQQRVAGGLKSVSSELDSMSASSQNPGVAADLVRQLSGRISGAATWLGDRDSASVLNEVKRYARRKPGTFILASALVGVAVGRLTRALASNASDASSHRATGLGNKPVASQWTPNGTPATAITDEETPLYAQSTAVRGDVLASEADDVRSDTF